MKAELSSNYTGRTVNTIKPNKEVKFSNKQIKVKEVWIGVFLDKLYYTTSNFISFMYYEKCPISSRHGLMKNTFLYL